MEKNKRYEVVAKWIKDNGPVDVLNVEFVDYYVSMTGMKSISMCRGADKCNQLTKDLREMLKRRMLTRHIICLGSNIQRGFPSWVYTYDLPATSDHGTSHTTRKPSPVAPRTSAPEKPERKNDE